MKSFFLILITIIALNLNMLAAQDSTLADSLSVPQIEFPEISYDFGSIGDDTTLTHTFVFTNTGTDSLRIKGVRPG